MAVIGRLDEQVDAVLISPLAKKRGETAPAAPPVPEQQQPSPSPTSAAADTADVESKVARETLPVWLL